MSSAPSDKLTLVPFHVKGPGRGATCPGVRQDSTAHTTVPRVCGTVTSVRWSVPTGAASSARLCRVVGVRPPVLLGNWGALQGPPRICPGVGHHKQVLMTVGQGRPNAACGVLREHGLRGERCVPLLRRRPRTALPVTCSSQFRRLDVQGPGDTVAFPCQDPHPGLQMAAFTPRPGRAGRTLQNNDVSAGVAGSPAAHLGRGTGTRSHSLPVAESGLEAGGCQHPSRHPALHPADPPPPHCVSTSKQTRKKVCEQ